MGTPDSIRNTLSTPIMVAGLLAVCPWLAGSETARAQVTGKVIGTVTDRDAGQPLGGAQVLIVGTTFGNVSNPDGYYFLNSVPVGEQQIRVSYLGYKDQIRRERIFAGQTMTVDFRLESEVVPVAPVVATLDFEPLVIRDQTVSKNRVTGERARALPVNDVREVVTLGAGIYENDGDFIIRGGRATESSTYVDGVLVSDFDIQRSRTQVGLFAVEEVDVVTGGFNAEFGHAQSGIINIVTREGGEAFHGAIRYLTDGRFGTDGYDADELAGFEREKCCGFNQLHASLGGPVVPSRLTFFGSLEATGAADIDPRRSGFNPIVGDLNSSGSRETILPGNRGDRTRIQTKLTAFPASNAKLSTTYLFGRDQSEVYDPNQLVAQGLSHATRTRTHDVILNYDHGILQSAVGSFNLSLRGHYHAAADLTGIPVSGAVASDLMEVLGDLCGAECDASAVTTFDDGDLNYRLGDVRFFFEDSLPLTVLDLPGETTLPDPVFGEARIWSLTDFSPLFDRRWERRYSFRGDVDVQLGRTWRIKAGGEWSWLNLTTESGRLDALFVLEMYDVDPRVGAAYMQHRLDYGDLVFDLGLRWDHFDPNTMVPLVSGEVDCEIAPVLVGCIEDAPLREPRAKDEWAPRLGVAHPVTDRTQVRLSYGKFHQLPELRHFFQNFNTPVDLSAFTYGNPNLDFIETTSFEAGVTHLLAENWVLDLVGYNRDRRGAIRRDIFQPGVITRTQDEFSSFVNADNGNVKGIDVTLAKRYSDYFSLDVAWSLQWARGTTSDPLLFSQTFGQLFDPLFPGRRLKPPTEQSPEAFDRTHVVNAQFNLRFPSDFHSTSLVGSVLSKAGAYLVYNGRSGTPYTRFTESSRGFPVEDFGATRLPWTHVFDLRLTKGLGLTGSLALELFLDFRNLLDTETVSSVSAITGRPDRSGEEFRLSRTPFMPRQFLVQGAPLGFPLPVDLVLPEFRDRVGNQDLDGDGVITLEEAQESLFRARVAASDNVYSYGEPRQVRFGAEIRF